MAGLSCISWGSPESHNRKSYSENCSKRCFFFSFLSASDHGSWEVSHSSTCKLEAQESLWCVAVAQAQGPGDWRKEGCIPACMKSPRLWSICVWIQEVMGISAQAEEENPFSVLGFCSGPQRLRSTHMGKINVLCLVLAQRLNFSKTFLTVMPRNITFQTTWELSSSIKLLHRINHHILQEATPTHPIRNQVPHTPPPSLTFRCKICSVAQIKKHPWLQCQPCLLSTRPYFDMISAIGYIVAEVADHCLQRKVPDTA